MGLSELSRDFLESIIGEVSTEALQGEVESIKESLSEAEELINLINEELAGRLPEEPEEPEEPVTEP